MLCNVLPDIHWVGGNPWDGSKTNVYGWASWNGKKATLALRNGSNKVGTYEFTLREALNIPANVKGSVIFRKSFSEQNNMGGFILGEPVDIDTKITAKLLGNSVYSFDGVIANGKNAELFDLSGRKLNTVPAKGVYIQNGKKVVR